MNSEDIQCYRANYDRQGWADIARMTNRFPVEGALNAIHTLCDEVERLQTENQRLREALESIACNEWEKMTSLEFWENYSKHDLSEVIVQDTQIARAALEGK